MQLNTDCLPVMYVTSIDRPPMELLILQYLTTVRVVECIECRSYVNIDTDFSMWSFLSVQTLRDMLVEILHGLHMFCLSSHVIPK